MDAVRPGWLWFDGWAGRTRHPVEILAETPKRYRVRLLEDAYRHHAGKVGLLGPDPMPDYMLDALRGLPDDDSSEPWRAATPPMKRKRKTKDKGSITP